MEEIRKLTGVRAKFYKRLTKQCSEYCVFLCTTDDYERIPPNLLKKDRRSVITVTGTALPAVPGVMVEYFGDWKQDAKHGIRFEAKTYRFITPETKSGIISFLKSKAFPGIGEKTAREIVGLFGNETLDVIKESPEKLAGVPGMTSKRLGLIVESLKDSESFGDTAAFLATFGISSDTAVRIHERLGRDACSAIRNNPYILCSVRGIGFRTCDAIARALGLALTNPVRIGMGISEILKAHMAATGDTCMELDKLITETLGLLNEGLGNCVSKDLVRESLRELAVLKKICLRNRKYVFTGEYDDAERYSAEKLVRMAQNPVDVKPMEIEAAVESYRKASGMKLSDKQTEAVKTSLGNRVSVITGGPGTGKTTILKALIECYEKLFGGGITLMAPTGKAARRMSESTGYEASTIHSRIGLIGDCRISERSYIPYSLIVLDESSMVDMLLLSELMLSIEDTDSHLVFIGDTDQLESIGPGCVLHDLISSGVIPVSRLTEIFRQAEGGIIAQNAKKINEGDMNLSYDDDFMIINAESEDEALKVIKEKYLEEIKEFGSDSVALLSPLRRSQNGRLKVVSDCINPVLQDIVNPPGENSQSVTFFKCEYRTGDRVLQWRNTEMSSNGDIGTITGIYEEDGDTAIMVSWENGNRTRETRQTMEDISLAYSMSVHKSQGSEYDSVIIPVLSAQSCRLFKRNLLYTGVTRAKKKVIIVGDMKAVKECITRCDATKRKTLFADWLRTYERDLKEEICHE